MLQFKDNALHQTTESFHKIWTIQELLETHNPLPGELLVERNGAMKRVVEMAEEMFGELSDAAKLRYDFWKLFLPGRISEQRFEYTTKVTATYEWELTINELGFFYKDISGEYDGRAGRVSEQLFSDFWFHGPLLPIPDVQVRKQLVAAIRNAFLQVGSPASYKHFELFEYPKPVVSLRYWEFGDHKASDYIAVRYYGIEMGASNWHDGPVWTGFLSFENFLTLPLPEGSIITPEIRAEIEKIIAPNIARKRAEDRAAQSTAPADHDW